MVDSIINKIPSCTKIIKQEIIIDEQISMIYQKRDARALNLQTFCYNFLFSYSSCFVNLKGSCRQNLISKHERVFEKYKGFGLINQKMIEVEKSANEKGDSEDSDDSISDQLNEDELMDMNQHMKTKRSGRNVRMSVQMESIYKEALMNVIFGQFTQANQKLKHLITANPDNPEPYHLMGTMYEETNDMKKAVEYYLISTYLAPPNFQKWVKVADMSMQLKMYSQAAYCFGRALKIDNYNIDLSIKRAEAFELCGQDRKAITMYKRILKLNNSLTTVKKYAKLRFKRGEFDKARQILLSSEVKKQGQIGQNSLDQNVLFMVCETFLREMKYRELLDFMLSRIIKPKQQQGHNQSELNFIQFDLSSTPVQFIRLLYICLLANPQKDIPGITLKQVQNTFYQAYEEEDAEQYEEVAKHLTKINQNQGLKLVDWLLSLQNSKHKTVDNYLILSQYLKKNGEIQKAERIISKGIIQHPQSAQLQIQITHFRVLLGKNINDNQTGRKQKHRKNIRRNEKKSQEEIFEESEEEDLFPDLSSNNFQMQQSHEMQQKSEKYGQFFSSQKKQHKSKDQEPKNNKNSVTRAKKHIKTNDQEIIQKVLENTRLTITKILESLQLQIINKKSHEDSALNQVSSIQSVPQCATKYYKDVFKSIELIAELTSNFQNQNENENAGNIQMGNYSSIIFNKNQVKRRSPAAGFKFFSQQVSGSKSKLSLRNVEANRFINQNVEVIAEIIQKVIRFQMILLKEKHYKKVIGLAEQLARSHVLRRHLRNQFLIKTKVKVYQIAVLACLQIKKYGKGLFFMRYLINRHPENVFYVLLLGFFARNSPKKNCLGPMFRKFIANKPKQGEQLFRYLLALQHLETSQYEISLNLFLGILSSQKGLSKEQKSKLFLICAACLLQIASSRNTFNKLEQVNRSAFFMRKYIEVMSENFKSMNQNCTENNKGENPYVLFNIGRWYSQIKLYSKAIECYTKVTKIVEQYQQKDKQDLNLDRVKRKAAINLMIIFKEMEMWENVQQLSTKYFSIEQEEKEVNQC